jgi:hypothetical protein
LGQELISEQELDDLLADLRHALSNDDDVLEVRTPIHMSDELKAQRPDISTEDLHQFEKLRLAMADVEPELLKEPAVMTRLILEVVDALREDRRDSLRHEDDGPALPEEEQGR